MRRPVAWITMLAGIEVSLYDGAGWILFVAGVLWELGAYLGGQE
jgi:hypothetical protein